MRPDTGGADLDDGRPGVLGRVEGAGAVDVLGPLEARISIVVTPASWCRSGARASTAVAVDQLVPLEARISTVVASTCWYRSPRGPRPWPPRPAGAGRGADLDRGRPDQLGPVAVRSSTAVASTS